ncbi:hypothetical protein [Nocardioides mangrovi]|uniref:Lipoprotein n=1 Tax=Nocardioides mangrovi TaxID=2874580 RepID=A0ABS7UJ12_9ACTN|nr:hypothetical protein [Nocardioides mangrovi]MBZ5740623.1 hypothetical protein [Nocardioides mangrovi]
MSGLRGAALFLGLVLVAGCGELHEPQPRTAAEVTRAPADAVGPYLTVSQARVREATECSAHGWLDPATRTRFRGVGFDPESHVRLTWSAPGAARARPVVIATVTASSSGQVDVVARTPRSPRSGHGLVRMTGLSARGTRLAMTSHPGAVRPCPVSRAAAP